MKRVVAIDFIAPLAVLALFTMVCRLEDLAIANRFYSPGGGWIYKHALAVRLLHRYCQLPGVLLGAAGAVVFGMSFIDRSFRFGRKPGLYLLLVLALGPGLIVNGVLKNHWGRPRPKQIEQFGGERKFLALWEKGSHPRARSFPSGHAAMGFYVLTPFFIFRGASRRRAVMWLVGGIAYGSIVGLGRMLQGAHFAGDVLWAFGFVYLTGLSLAYAFRFQGSSQCEEWAASRSLLGKGDEAVETMQCEY